MALRFSKFSEGDGKYVNIGIEDSILVAALLVRSLQNAAFQILVSSNLGAKTTLGREYRILISLCQEISRGPTGVNVERLAMVNIV